MSFSAEFLNGCYSIDIGGIDDIGGTEPFRHLKLGVNHINRNDICACKCHILHCEVPQTTGAEDGDGCGGSGSGQLYGLRGRDTGAREWCRVERDQPRWVPSQQRRYSWVLHSLLTSAHYLHTKSASCER